MKPKYKFECHLCLDRLLSLSELLSHLSVQHQVVVPTPSYEQKYKLFLSIEVESSDESSSEEESTNITMTQVYANITHIEVETY